MALLRKFPNGFEIHGGRMTKSEESEFYARIAGGPKVVLWGQRANKTEKAEPASAGKTKKTKK